MNASSAVQLDTFVANLVSRLRGAGVRPGIGEIVAAIEAIRGGYGIGSVEALQRILVLLWAKSYSDKLLIERHVGELIQAALTGGGTTHRARRSSHGRYNNGAEREGRVHEGGNHSQRADAARSPENSVGSYAKEVSDATARLVQASAGDEVAVAMSLAALRIGVDVASAPVALNLDFLPVSQRQLKQLWRYLRRTQLAPRSDIVDVDATVRRFAGSGLLSEVVTRPSRINTARILLLIDSGGSMVPFKPLTRRLVHTATTESRLAGVETAYFHDTPEGTLFSDENRTKPALDLFDGGRDRQPGVLIVGDAGAARGRYDAARVRSMVEAVRSIQGRAPATVWLNPVPRYRWPGTSAEALSEVVPSFELDRAGMHAAIRLLKGSRGGRAWS